MSIKYLDTERMSETVQTFKNEISNFEKTKLDIERATNDLLKDWVGKGRNSFEKKYKLLYGQLKDIEESLEEFYEALVESQSSYYDADEEFAKKINM
ncbi:WXG100 family type VII secretion target [Clostridium sp. UBA7503]|uniref:WXG100 family type VII secretion target n=1 Tax=Clostridium sp. UBA7503 TaxID=1946377 RepID=UPI0032164220